MNHRETLGIIAMGFVHYTFKLVHGIYQDEQYHVHLTDDDREVAVTLTVIETHIHGTVIVTWTAPPHPWIHHTVAPDPAVTMTVHDTIARLTILIDQPRENTVFMQVGKRVRTIVTWIGEQEQKAAWVQQGIDGGRVA